NTRSRSWSCRPRRWRSGCGSAPSSPTSPGSPARPAAPCRSLFAEPVARQGGPAAVALASAHPLPGPAIPSSLAAPRLNVRRLAQPRNGGDPITRRQVAPAGHTLGPDERLYALPIPAETAQGLHLQSGDQVEIVVTTNRTRPDQAETRVVLPAVTIFSTSSS